MDLCYLRVVSHDMTFSDTANFPLPLSHKGISQYTSIVNVRNGKDAFDTKSVETVSKHHDVSSKVVIPVIRYLSDCQSEKKIIKTIKTNDELKN